MLLTKVVKTKNAKLLGMHFGLFWFKSSTGFYTREEVSDVSPTFVTCELAFRFNINLVTFRYNYVTKYALFSTVFGGLNGIAKIILRTSGLN